MDKIVSVYDICKHRSYTIPYRAVDKKKSYIVIENHGKSKPEDSFILVLKPRYYKLSPHAGCINFVVNRKSWLKFFG